MYFVEQTRALSGLGGVKCQAELGCVADNEQDAQPLRDVIAAARTNLDFSWSPAGAPSITNFNNYGTVQPQITEADLRKIFLALNDPAWTLPKLYQAISSAGLRSLRTAIAAKGGAASTPAPAPTSVAPSAAASASYKCSTTICYGTNSTAQANIIAVQKLLNKFGGSAGFKPIGVDGKIGDQTVAAMNLTNAWMAKSGGWKRATVTKQQFAAAAVTGAVAPALQKAIELTKPEAAPTSSGAPTPVPSDPPYVAPADAHQPPSPYPTWLPYVAAGAGGLALLAVAYKLSAPKALPALAPATGVAGAGRRGRARRRGNVRA